MRPSEPVAPLEVGLRGGNTSREQLKCPFLGAASVRSLSVHAEATWHLR